MAANSKKASSKKASAKKSGSPEKISNETTASRTGNAGYFRLRIILDSLEIGALRYYLDNTSPAEKKKRLKELEYDLLPIIRKLWPSVSSLDTCPPGYRNCDGCCVPYSCTL